MRGRWPWLGVVAMLVGCAPAGERELTLSAAPSTLNGLGRTAWLTLVATEADGTTGHGTVTLQAFVGEVDDETMELDAFGTARTRYTCPSSMPGCNPGEPLDLEARWLVDGKRVATVKRALQIERPPVVWTSAACPEEAKLIYLFTETADLYSFSPPTKAMQRLGHLACPAATGARPNSMAVSQDGVGWVNFDDGSLFRVNVRTAACTATTFLPPAGWTRFGMGFSPDSATAPSETLFIAGDTQLARVDLQAMRASVIGTLAGAARGSAELTGTTDGRLFGFFPPAAAGGSMSMAEVDKATAATSSPKVFTTLTLGQSYAYAFSSWGEDFYLYTSSDGATSTVTKYAPSSDAVTTYMTAPSGVHILGAGVSRCGAE